MKQKLIFLLLLVCGVWLPQKGSAQYYFQNLYTNTSIPAPSCGGTLAAHQNAGIIHSNGYYYGVGYYNCLVKDPMITRVDKNGNMGSSYANTWAYEYSTGSSSSGQMLSLCEDGNHDIIATGDMNTGSSSRFALLKTNSSGSSPIFHSYNNSVSNESHGVKAISAHDISGNFNGYISVGYIYTSAGHPKIMVVKTNSSLSSSGTSLWQKYITITFAGNTIDAKGVDVIEKSGTDHFIILANADPYVYMCEIDQSGALVTGSDKLYRFGTGQNYVANRIIETNTDYAITGGAYNGTNNYIMFVKIDKTTLGPSVANRYLRTSYISIGQDIYQTSSGGFIITGNSDAYATLLSIDNGGTLSSAVGFTQSGYTYSNYNMSICPDNSFLLSGSALASGVNEPYFGKVDFSSGPCQKTSLSFSTTSDAQTTNNPTSAFTSVSGEVTASTITTTPLPYANSTSLSCSACVAPATPSITGNTCTGNTGSTTLSTTGVSGVDYQWYIGGSTTLGTSNTQTAAGDGTYTIKESYAPSCSATSSGFVVHTPSAPVLTGTCNFSGSYAMDAGAGPTYYKWYQIGNPTPICTTQICTIATIGKYYVTVSYDNTCWVNSNEVVVSNIVADFAYTYNYTSLTCSTGVTYPTYSFTDASSITIPTGVTVFYDWDFGDGTTHAYVQNPTHNYLCSSCSTTWTVTLTVTVDGCPNAISYAIHVSTAPPSVSSYTFTYDCVNNKAVPYLTIPGFGSDFLFDWGAGTGVGGTGRYSEHPTLDGSTSGPTNYTLTLYNNHCSATVTITVPQFTSNSFTLAFSPSLIHLFSYEPSIDLSGWVNNYTTSSYFSIAGGGTITYSSGFNMPGTAMTATPGSTSNITFTYIDAATSCTQAATAQYYNEGDINMTTTGATSCPYGTANLSASVSLPGTMDFTNVSLYVEWASNSSFSSLLQAATSITSGTTISYLPVSPSTSTTYYARLKIVRPGLPTVYMFTQSVSLTVYSPITVNILNSSSVSIKNTTQYVCTHSSFPTLTASFPDPSPYSYTVQWVKTCSSCSTQYFTSHTVSSGSTTDVLSSSSITDPGNYTIYITDHNGCTYYAIVTLQDITPNPVLIGATSIYACSSSGSMQQLTGLCSTSTIPGNTYVHSWQQQISSSPVTWGTSFSSACSTNVFAGTYLYTVSNSLTPSCPVTATITIYPAPALTISSSISGGSTILTVCPGLTRADVIRFYPTSSINVYKDGILITRTSLTIPAAGASTTPFTIDISGFGSGYYSITAFDACNSNVLTGSNTVHVGCTPPSSYTATYNSSSSFSSGTTYLTGGSYEFNGTVTIPNGVTLQINSSSIQMTGSCPEIIIEPGGELDLFAVNISSCNIWKGIHVIGDPTGAIANGKLLIGPAGSSSISDAWIGVYSETGGQLQINTTDFSNNVTHVAISEYKNSSGSYLDINSYISQCNFGEMIFPLSGSCTAAFTPTLYPSPSNNRMVYVEKVKGLTIENCVFSGVYQPSPSTAIDLYGVQSSPAVTILQNQFLNYLTTGVYAAKYQATISSSPVSCDGVVLKQTNMFGYGLNPVNPVNGLILNNVDNFQIGDPSTPTSTPVTAPAQNIFQYLVKGVQFYGTGAGQTVLEHNYFTNNTYALVIAQKVDPLTTSGVNTGSGSINLKTHCNYIENNHIGFIGSGALIQQGSGSGASTTTCDNIFDNSSISMNDCDILWEGSLGFEYDYPRFAPGSTTFLSTGSEIINGNTISSSTGSLNINPSNDNLCWVNGWEVGYTSSVKKEKLDFNAKVYPNPSQNVFVLEMEGTSAQKVYAIEILDILGRKLVSKSISGKMPEIIQSQEWPAGTYFLKIIDENGPVFTQKLVKQK